ncbi:MAG: EF-hand domain-containing protein [Acidobacteriaceae bacterium]|nr:EF-hand domain-containing protein [Acidobacteriaceae bacterium]
MLAAAALLAVFAAGSKAQGPGGGPRLALKALDTDGDGKLSAAEIAAASHSLLTLDRNGDGQLTADELSQRPQNAGASADDLVSQLMAFDQNKDGVLTRDELPARMQNLFDRADTNHDGKLTPDEIRALARRQGMPGGRPTEPGHASGLFRMDPLLNALDTNHDGVLSDAEIAAAPQTLLTLDANHDGILTPDEMPMHQMSPSERAAHMLDEWDTNHDGRISKDEAPERMQAQFVEIDTDGDGYLSKEEIIVFYSKMPAGGGRTGGEAQRPQGTNGEGQH